MTPNAVYIGSLEIYLGGLKAKHKGPMKGMPGFAEEVLGQWFFQPEGIRPIPESNQESSVMSLHFKGKEMTVGEQLIWDDMVNSITYRVRYEDLYLLDG